MRSLLNDSGRHNVEYPDTSPSLSREEDATITLILNRSDKKRSFICTMREKDPNGVAYYVGKQADIAPGECRYVQNARIKKHKHVYVLVVLKDDAGAVVKWVSQEIGPGQFWVFDGKKIYEDESLGQSDCVKDHGW